MSRYRKALTAVGLGVVEVAAYVTANPKDLPGWAVAAAAAVNAAAVWAVPNKLDEPEEEPTRYQPPLRSGNVTVHDPKRPAE